MTLPAPVAVAARMRHAHRASSAGRARGGPVPVPPQVQDVRRELGASAERSQLAVVVRGGDATDVTHDDVSPRRRCVRSDVSPLVPSADRRRRPASSLGREGCPPRAYREALPLHPRRSGRGRR
eukprot:31432-Pelagococcus_subviridis.AAC.6